MLGVTMRVMRVEYANGGAEIRDCLDRAWWPFLRLALPDQNVLPLPNIGRTVLPLIQNLHMSGFIFSGGDDWGVYPERDETEKAIFAYAQKHALPLMGICRGAQVINILLGGSLAPVSASAHVCRRHKLRIAGPLQRICGESAAVNSYHVHGIFNHDLAPGLAACALCEDASIEAFCSVDEKMCGLMWHPEREAEPAAHDLTLFGHFLKKDKT